MELDALRAAREALMEHLRRGPGTVSPKLRAEAAAGGAGLPSDLAGFVEKIHRHAYQVTDEEVAALRARHGDDALFEIVIAAAAGAAEQRFLAGMKALEEASAGEGVAA